MDKDGFFKSVAKAAAQTAVRTIAVMVARDAYVWATSDAPKNLLRRLKEKKETTSYKRVEYNVKSSKPLEDD